MLGLAVATLRQTVDSVVAAAPGERRPLTGLAQVELIADLLTHFQQTGRLRHYRGTLPPRRLAAELAAAFRQIAQQAAAGDAAWQAGPGAVGRDIALLFRAYRAELTRAGSNDPETRIEQAIALLQQQAAAGVRQGAVLVTGATRFTPLERRLVAALGEVAGRVVVTLPAWEEPASPHAAMVQREAEALAAVFDCHETTRVASTESTPARRHVSRWLFGDVRSTDTPAADAGIRVAAADSSLDELHEVAAQAKRLLAGGVPAERLLLAARRVADVAPYARQAFAQAGVPLAVDDRPRLIDAPIYRTLTRLVDLGALDWRREDLLALVTTPAAGRFDRLEATDAWLKPIAERAGFAGPRAAAEWAIREQLTQSGAEAWLEPLRRLAISPGDAADERFNPRHARRRVAAAAAIALLDPVDQWTREWRSSATPLDWFDRLRDAAAWLRYRIDGDAASARADLAALPAVEAALAAVERLQAWRGQSSRRLPLSELATLLTWWAHEAPLDAPANDEGRVRLVSAETAATLTADSLFLVGMGEASFPAAMPSPPVSHLAPSIDEHYAREMLLFHQLVTAVAPAVTISYAAIDTKGQPLLPSSYVAELQRLLPASEVQQANFASDQPLATAAAWRTDAVRRWQAGDPSSLAATLGSGLPGTATLEAGLRTVLARGIGDGFGPAEGLLASQPAAAKLAERFGPERLWSPTQLETYAECPYKFFLKHLANVEAIEEGELDISHRRRGSLLHDALAALHAGLRDEGRSLAEFAALDEAAFAESFGKALQQAAATPRDAAEAALADIERRQAEAWAPGYHKQVDAYANSAGPLQPSLFEVGFGPARDGGPPAEGDLAEPFRLELDGESILLIGRVDRIDLGEVGGVCVFNVVDYKTSSEVKTKLDLLHDGRQLQLFVYALATQQHLLADRAAQPWRVGYWEIRGVGFKQPGTKKDPLVGAEVEGGIVVATDAWSACDQAVRRRIGEIVGGVRRGEFPMHNPNQECGKFCDYRTVCRVGQVRSLGKLPPPASPQPMAAPTAAAPSAGEAGA
ncbi:MAG: PD-(D/E)XK nuclease family protein [Planctomycetota bacterium]